jgi:hypothetical protein
MARLQCPNCQSENTWATYIHDPCPQAPTGKTTWEVPAEGETQDSRPYPQPCPAPLDGTMTPAAYVQCRDCGHRWGDSTT